MGARGVDDHGTSYRNLDCRRTPTVHDSPKLIGLDEQCSLNESEQSKESKKRHDVAVALWA